MVLLRNEKGKYTSWRDWKKGRNHQDSITFAIVSCPSLSCLLQLHPLSWSKEKSAEGIRHYTLKARFSPPCRPAASFSLRVRRRNGLKIRHEDQKSRSIASTRGKVFDLQNFSECFIDWESTPTLLPWVPIFRATEKRKVHNTITPYLRVPWPSKNRSRAVGAMKSVTESRVNISLTYVSTRFELLMSRFGSPIVDWTEERKMNLPQMSVCQSQNGWLSGTEIPD